jgi:hypothetical protein
MDSTLKNVFNFAASYSADKQHKGRSFPFRGVSFVGHQEIIT